MKRVRRPNARVAAVGVAGADTAAVVEAAGAGIAAVAGAVVVAAVVIAAGTVAVIVEIAATAGNFQQVSKFFDANRVKTSLLEFRFVATLFFPRALFTHAAPRYL